MQNDKEENPSKPTPSPDHLFHSFPFIISHAHSHTFQNAPRSQNLLSAPLTLFACLCSIQVKGANNKAPSMHMNVANICQSQIIVAPPGQKNFTISFS